MIPIEQQISEVRRELAMRRNVYPRMIASGKMRQGEAAECTKRMQAVHDTLEWMQRNEARIKAALAAEQEG